MNREERLMAYLYGEMEAEEKLAFEKEIEKDPELRAELGRFKKPSFVYRNFPICSPKQRYLASAETRASTGENGACD